MNQEKKYDVELIIKKCDTLESIKDLVNYIKQIKIFKGKRLSFLFPLYDILKKEFIIKTLEKALNNANNENKDPGDIFISLVKNSDLLNKELLDKIFYRNNKFKERNKIRKMNRKLNKQLIKSFEMLNIDDKNDKNKVEDYDI